VSYAAITLCIASQRVFITVISLSTQSGNFWISASRSPECLEYQESPRESGRFGVEWDTSLLVYADDVNTLGDTVKTIKKNTEIL
jgi:hypothetical protein